jgi:5'-3' exonuclease
MATLRGDTSDGLPGVAGIGEKTAATLINRYGDLASLRRALAEGDPQIKGAQRQRLEAASAYLDVAPLVVQVALDAPIPDFDASLPRQVGDVTLLSSLAAQYRLANHLNRVLGALGLGENE